MWPQAYGVPAQQAVLRATPEDFRVDEALDIEFSGSGEFDWVLVEKTGLTTEAVAKMLARHAGVRDVSYSGLKDKNAVTTQWFSLHMRGAPSADWLGFDNPQCRVLRSVRHQRKLKRGTHRFNRFALRLREVADVDAVISRLQAVRAGGVPNYFGEQRFGRDGDNVERARQWFDGQGRPGRFQRGIYLSAVRSHLFNSVLGQRVGDGTWQRALAGEVLVLGNSNSVFRAADDAEIVERLGRGEIHPSGPLPGRAAGLMPGDEAARVEQTVLAQAPELCAGLDRAGVDAARRSLRLFAQDLDWRGGDGILTLSFTLPRGCFATALVRELVRYQ